MRATQQLDQEWIPVRNDPATARMEKTMELEYKRIRTALRRPIAPIKRPTTRIGRNDPCPCGSGKKFKRCHLQTFARQDQQKEADNEPN